MNKTKKQETNESITLDAPTLQTLLNCGRYTAEKIASDAGAKIKIGKRVLYDRRKIEAYLEKQAGA